MWDKKNLVIGGLAILLGLSFLGSSSGTQEVTVGSQQFQGTPSTSLVIVTPSPTPSSSSTSNSGLSNDNTYINSEGNEVHSPAYSNTTPVGATAICGDGTYSFSQSRRGTCSHHGGVSQWL